MKYVLIEVLDGEISAPEFFDTIEEARAKMRKYVMESVDGRFDEEENIKEYCTFNKDQAWVGDENKKDNEWAIFAI